MFWGKQKAEQTQVEKIKKARNQMKDAGLKLQKAVEEQDALLKFMKELKEKQS